MMKKDTLQNTMQTSLRYMTVSLLAVAVLSACKKEEIEPIEPEPTTLEVKYVTDIVADTGNVGLYTFYSLRENKIIAQSDSATDKWDLGFKGTTIINNSGISGPGNGGATIVDGIFEELNTAPSSFSTDGTSSLAIPTASNNGWYQYTSTNPPEHAILPIAGKVIMVRTADGKYAKVEIQSYYKGKPNTTTPEFANLATRPPGRHYNFRFVYQPDGSTNLN